VINENLETIINNKQEIKDLKLKLDENIKILNSSLSNYKQLEFDKNIEITSYKQQVNIILISWIILSVFFLKIHQINENLETTKMNLIEFELKNEQLNDQLYLKEVVFIIIT
jgi:hypothetical protein